MVSEIFLVQRFLIDLVFIVLIDLIDLINETI